MAINWVPQLPKLCVFGLRKPLFFGKKTTTKFTRTLAKLFSILDIEDSILHNIVKTIRLSLAGYIAD